MDDIERKHFSGVYTSAIEWVGKVIRYDQKKWQELFSCLLMVVVDVVEFKLFESDPWDFEQYFDMIYDLLDMELYYG